MDLLKLPVPFLSSLSLKLNAIDLINLFTAIYNTSKPAELQNTYLFKLIFDKKQCDLENCFKLDYENLKKTLKFYKSKEFFVQKINVNFCVNLCRHTSLKRMINETLCKISSLTQLDLFNITSSNNQLDFVDLGKLVHSCKGLRHLSFNLSTNLDSSSHKMVHLDKLEFLRVEFKSSSAQTLLKLLSSHCSNLTHLELYSSYDESAFSLNLTSQNFPHHQLPKLSHLVTGTNNITLTLNNFMFDLVEKLNTFSLNVSVDKSNSQLSRLINQEKIEKCDLNFGIDLSYLRSNNIVLNTNPYVLDDLVKDYFALDFADKLNSIKLYILIWPCILSTINLSLNTTKHLKIIDFSSIHIHSKESICQLISSLNELNELGLPCCALSRELFEKKEKKTSFKRIFEESDEEENSSSDEKKSRSSKKELSYLNNNKLVKLSICSPDSVNFKDKYFFNCSNLDIAELAEIPKWACIKSLSFSDFKLIGGVSRFDLFLNELATQTVLNELNLSNFNSFLTYDFQVVFTKNLKKFSYLKKLTINHLSFSFSAKFCQSLIQLASSLVVLKLKIENFNCKVFADHLNGFRNFRNLIMFEIICKNKESDIKFIKKSLKNVLSDWTFYQIYNINSSNLFTQHQQCKPTIFLRVCTKNVQFLNENNFNLNTRNFY